MALFSTKRQMAHLGRHSGKLFLSALLLALVGLSGSASAISPDDQHCLSCHQAPMEKPLTNGETLSLQIDPGHFDKSVHGGFGCATCHSDIDASKHPNAVMPIESKRAFSVERSKVCATCHTDQATQWSHSVHAALVKAGNPLAPVCTSCHNPHTLLKGAAATMDTVPCKTCHSDVFDAYSKSVHGVLRNAGLNQAPLCFTCHGAHAVKVPTANMGLKDTCFGCHKDAPAKHAEWLPNAQLHFSVVSCVACHSPNAHRRVNLVLYNPKTKLDTSRPLGVPEFKSASDSADKNGLAPIALLSAMRALNQPGVADKTAIRGRLDVTTAAEAHLLAPASDAIRNCTVCHRKGSEAFESVTISVAGEGGIPIEYDVDKAALHSVFSLPAMGGFYAIGATRITLFDVLLVLALLVGFGIPALHLTIRFLAHRPGDKKPNNHS